MIIKRIYNNSVAVVLGRNEQELIVIGKGIAYQKKIGDKIDDLLIDKVFMLQDKHEMSKLEEIIAGVPTVYLRIADEIIEMIKANSNLILSDKIYITLIDHISISLEREQKGIIFENPLLMEIKQFYKQEYKLAKEAAQIIESYLNIVISDDETGFITLHIVNASMNQNIEDTMKTTHIIQDILDIVQNYYQMEPDRESLSYNRFVRHLQFFAKRIMDKAEDEAEDDFMYRMGRLEFPEVYQCVNEIFALMNERYKVTISNAEFGYLIYHIKNVTLGMKNRMNRSDKSE